MGKISGSSCYPDIQSSDGIDMDIILGGDVGGVLTEYMIPLGQRVLSYNGFDRDISYLKNCSYEKEASAVGAAKHFLYEYVKECCS